MTAVEWFFRWFNDNPEATHKEYAEAFQQALKMEKNQIETLKNSILELFEMVHNGCNIRDQIRANEIYCETYKKYNK